MNAITRRIEQKDAIYQRHWCPKSERFTGCDSLLSLLDEGWRLRKRIVVQRVYFENRSNYVFQLLLEKDSRLMRISVIDVPSLRRLLVEMELIPVNFWLRQPRIMFEEETIETPVFADEARSTI